MARLRRRRGVFYYRSRVPSDLKVRIGRTEFTYSLKTADRETAAARCHDLSARQLRLCRVLRQAPAEMSQAKIDALVQHYMDAFWEGREEDASTYGALTVQQTEERRARLRGDLARAEDDLAQNNLDSAEHLALRLMGETGHTLDPESNFFARLCFRLLNARVELLRQDADRIGTNGAKPAAVQDSPRVSVLVQEYLKFRDASDPYRPNTRLEAVAAFGLLTDLLGDPVIAEVRKRDAQDFVAKMAQMPRRWRQKFKGKTATELLRDTEGMDIPRASAATVNKELGLMKAFWSWCVTRLELPSNAMDAAKPLDAGNAKSKRRPFTKEELADIADAVSAQKDKRGERFWIVTLLAYTGARLEEIAQLRKRDVLDVEGIPSVKITAEAGSLKNEATERIVPIHSAVLARGFLEFVANRPEGHLWTETAEAKDKFGAPVSKWFGRLITRLKVTDRAKKGLHSLRHNMRDALIGAGVDPVVRREIMGHAHEDVEDTVYGDPVGVAQRRIALEKVSLPF